ncbi:MAG: type 1 glutamine amidotransferase [Pseudomonadota bacterium]
MHIGLLQTGHMVDEIVAEMGDYPEFYSRLLNPEGLRLTAWPVVDGVFPDHVRDAEGWLISGSRHGAYEDLDWLLPLEALIRDIYAAGVPIVGICFGHQIIAKALGGTVEKYSGGWAVGRHTYDWDGEEVVLNAWHQDQITALPPGAEVVASSPFCDYAALTYGDGIFSVQAHPEFDADATKLLLDIRAPGVVPDDRIAAARADLDRPTDNARLAREIAAFFRKAKSHDQVA